VQWPGGLGESRHPHESLDLVAARPERRLPAGWWGARGDLRRIPIGSAASQVVRRVVRSRGSPGVSGTRQGLDRTAERPNGGLSHCTPKKRIEAKTRISKNYCCLIKKYTAILEGGSGSDDDADVSIAPLEARPAHRRVGRPWRHPYVGDRDMFTASATDTSAPRGDGSHAATP
jgi:hypothetical protein